MNNSFSCNPFPLKKRKMYKYKKIQYKTYIIKLFILPEELQYILGASEIKNLNNYFPDNKEVFPICKSIIKLY